MYLLFKIYLYLLFIGSIVSLELLILLLGILLKNKVVFFLWTIWILLFSLFRYSIYCSLKQSKEKMRG
ncbi:conserved domain protein [Streptococcus parasanguinis SK236]|nr:conserved domain protein [Streptococcus parasanguinis SK236]